MILKMTMTSIISQPVSDPPIVSPLSPAVSGTGRYYCYCYHATLKLTETSFEYLEKIQIEIFFEFVSRYF